MKFIVAILVPPLLAGCNALGGIPENAINGIANAGGGCVYVKSLVMGEAVYMVSSADKGSLRNGEVSVAANCGGITIRDAASVRAVAPVAPVKPVQ